MTIEGHRPFYDVGPAVSPYPTSPSASPAPAPSAPPRDPTGTIPPVTPAASGQGIGNPPSRQNTDAPRTPDRSAAAPLKAREPTLPQLSAEALATALMTAEPDKAVVPRVLPAHADAADGSDGSERQP